MANVEGRGWSSNRGFILAAAGAAIGLGNLWRFPFLAGENGGGAFVLVYVICVLLIGVPIMLAELVLGREGRGSALLSMRRLTENGQAHPAWRVVGFLSIIIPFIGIGYYSVAGGWVVDYASSAMLGNAGSPSGEAAAARFADMLGNPVRLLVAHSVFMIGVVLVLIRGVQGGIEKLAKVLMPTLFLLLVGLVIYAAFNANMSAAIDFLFKPDFAKITGKTIVMAAGQAFFSLAIGVGIMITYGSYVPKGTSLVRSVAVICVMDTMVALMAGLVIFPFVFAVEGLDPSSGPGLMFVTLPAAFGQMSGGAIVGGLFFLLLFFAAFTTGIGTMEPVIAWAEEKRGMTRKKAAILIGIAAWFIGILALLSFNIWEDFSPLAWVPGFEGKNIFDTLDFAIASFLLPLNGFLIALFTGWVICKKVENVGLSPLGEKLWGWSLRVVVPVAIIFVAFSN